MKKFKIGNEWITRHDLYQCEQLIPKELIQVMDYKIQNILSDINARLSFEEQCTYRELLKMGYLAANCTNDMEENIELSLTPLGQALKEDE